MTVLLLRIRAVLPFGWNSYIKSLHVVLVGMRIIIGAVDVVLLERAVLPSGACQFQENKAVSNSVWVDLGYIFIGSGINVLKWGPVYTVYDTLVDLYVTIAIGITLYRHVKRIRTSLDDEQASGSYYAIIMQNVIRTTVLFVSNLATVILMLKVTSNNACCFDGSIISHCLCMYIECKSNRSYYLLAHYQHAVYIANWL